MPWIPELFSATALEQIEEQHHEELVTVPYFEGLVAGELQPLLDSFVGVPELHDPVRGRVRGTPAFEGFVSEMASWLHRHHFSVKHVNRVRVNGCGCEEVELELDHHTGRIAVPVAIVGAGRPDWRLEELRIYFSGWSLTQGHLNRPPVLQRDPQLSDPGVVGDYQRALADAGLEAILDVFEPDGYLRDPRAKTFGRDDQALRAFYQLAFSNGGGIPLEHCHVIDDERSCALEYNVVRWGASDIPPQAGILVHQRGDAGKLAAVRVYDDVDPPARPPS